MRLTHSALNEKAVILVGAPAIYLHTGAIDLAVAEFTTDADITFDPALLERVPEIEAAMTAAGSIAPNESVRGS